MKYGVWYLQQKLSKFEFGPYWSYTTIFYIKFKSDITSSLKNSLLHK
jgi:hypothetical protein